VHEAILAISDAADTPAATASLGVASLALLKLHSTRSAFTTAFFEALRLLHECLGTGPALWLEAATRASSAATDSVRSYFSRSSREPSESLAMRQLDLECNCVGGRSGIAHQQLMSLLQLPLVGLHARSDDQCLEAILSSYSLRLQSLVFVEPSLLHERQRVLYRSTSSRRSLCL
jgi:hypothetical protein